jgi:hypothetical protein
VPEREFVFALKLAPADPGDRYDAMLDELATSVLGHVGYTQATIGEIVATLRDALAEGAGLRQCDVQFRAAAGELHIVVSYSGGRQWRTSRPLP